MSRDPRAGDPKPEAEDESAGGGRASGADVVVLGAALPDGEGVGVVRIRDEQVELGALHPLREGKPIRGEVVTLRPRPDAPRVCDVEVEVDVRPKPLERSHAGPARVSSQAYRDGWDQIWARDGKVDRAN